MKLNNSNDNTLTKWKKNDGNNVAMKEAKGDDKMTRSIC